MAPRQVDCTSPDDQALIERALRAAIRGPYFPDWEFSTLIGVDQSDVESVLEAWPEASHSLSWEGDPTRAQAIIVNNVLNNLAGYPHGGSARLLVDVGASEVELREVQRRWRTACAASHT